MHADVFEKFRAVSMEQGRFEVDTAHYVSAPQMACDAMLKKTDFVLDLITEPAMYLMIESGMSGGVCMISKRHAQANNPMVGNNDPEQPFSYILAWEANNLYGWAMSQFLPLNRFKWVSQVEWEQIDWQYVGNESILGYIVECDLEYPPELKDAQNDYPLAAERVDNQVELLSETQVAISRHYARTRSAKNFKLVPNLMSKKNYVVYYRNIKFYLDHRIRLSKIHRVVSLTQTGWMEPYISINNRMRAAAKNDMEKDFYKLMNNAVYGKTCENQRKRTDIDVVNDRVKAAKLVDKPHCLDARIFNEKLVGIEMQKVKMLLSKPSYVGFVVLELSKLLMLKYPIPTYHPIIPISLLYFPLNNTSTPN